MYHGSRRAGHCRASAEDQLMQSGFDYVFLSLDTHLPCRWDTITRSLQRRMEGDAETFGVWLGKALALLDRGQAVENRISGLVSFRFQCCFSSKPTLPSFQSCSLLLFLVFISSNSRLHLRNNDYDCYDVHDYMNHISPTVGCLRRSEGGVRPSMAAASHITRPNQELAYQE